MKTSVADEAGVASPSAGAWMVLYENLLAGIVHSMNNVVTVLGVSLELASTDDARGDIASLRSELAQLEQLIALTATLASRSAREEALELRVVLDIALTIHALNPSTRAVKCAVHVAGFIAPVRVPRAALLRVLLLMIDGAKQGDGAEARLSGLIFRETRTASSSAPRSAVSRAATRLRSRHRAAAF